MKQAEYLEKLKAELEKRNVKGVSEILQDYEEHFRSGLQNNKSEEEISAKLGNPSTIAVAYETDLLMDKAEATQSGGGAAVGSVLKGFIRLLIIAPFNFLMLTIPGAIIFAMLAAGWAVSLAFGAVAIALLTMLTKAFVMKIGFWAILACISGSIGVLGLALIGILIMLAISKEFLNMAIRYLRWNLNFILEK